MSSWRRKAIVFYLGHPPAFLLFLSTDYADYIDLEVCFIVENSKK
jgi:hypothetical protein